MKNPSPWLLVALCGGLWAGVAGAEDQPPPTPAGAAPAVTEVARWQIYSLDRELGVLIGDGAVDWSAHTAVVRFPHGGKTYRLEGTVIQTPSADEPRLRLQLKGRGPEAGVTVRPAMSAATTVEGGGEAKVTVAAEEDTFAFGVPGAAEDGVVSVDLAVDGEGDAEGRWYYAADPITQRDARGGGRVGRFSMAPNGDFAGQQSGSELWTRQIPEIDDAVVVENQLKIPHYLTPAGVEVDGRTVDRRTLFVVGRNLPIFPLGDSSRNLGKMESSAADTDYTYIGTSGDQLTKEDRDKLSQGWYAVQQRIKDPTLSKAVFSLESALIKVKLKPGFVPGMRTLTWGGVEIPWQLESRDAAADVAFVRHAGEPGDTTKWETVREAYLPEKIAVEIRLRKPIPFKSFAVKLQGFWVEDEGTLPGGGYSWAPKERAIGPVLEVEADRKGPLLYRTGTLTISRKAGGGIVMQPGAVLVAHASASGGGVLSAPATAQLAVSSSPGTGSPLWTEYLQRSAKTQGKETTDPRSLQALPETHISKTLLLLLDQLKTDIYFGHHAAMLLLRDTFLGSMRKADEALADSVSTDAGALGFASKARDDLGANPKAAIGLLSAGNLYGRAVTLAEAVGDLPLSLFKGDTDAKRREVRDSWVVTAVRTAVGEYRERVHKSSKATEAIADSDVEKLLQLTGHEFGPVVAQAIPRLMRFDEASQSWVLDVAARGYVGELSEKYKELRAHQAAADKDTYYSKLIAELVANAALGGLPSLMTKSGTAFMIAAGGRGVMWAAKGAAEIYGTMKVKDEIAFAFGATPVLGDAQFQEAVLADKSWTTTLAWLGVDTVMSGSNVVGDIRKAQAAIRIARGSRIADKTFTFWQVSKLAEDQQRDFIAFLAHARSLIRQGKTDTLTATGRLAVKNFEGLAKLAEEDPKAVALVVAASTKVSQAQSAIAKEIEKSVAGKAAKEVLDNLRLRQNVIDDIWQAAANETWAAAGKHAAKILVKLTKLSDFELGWLSGAIKQPDASRALALVGKYDNNWHHLKNAFMDGNVSAAELHNFVTHREKFMAKLLDESIGEVAADIERETGRKLVLTGAKPDLYKKALGSTNLTSDLDYSVYGEGAERVVKVFNDKFRALKEFKGLESGYVFDTNVYTQAVYELYGRNMLIGKSMGLANADLDALRQLMYEAMATRKYIGSAAEWETFTAKLLSAAPDNATRKMFASNFEEADYAYRSARSAIAKRLGVSGDEALHAAEGGNGLLRATNQAYEDLLADIGQWRNEFTRLQQLKTGKVGKLAEASEQFMERYPGWRLDLKELRNLKAAGKTAEFDALASTWKDRLAYMLRKKQGEALFYASEAYQDEATILHVVKDLQEFKRGKAITLAKFKGGKVSKVLSTSDGRGALNSMMENLANLRKEFRHADDATKAAAKGGKYFIRVLDGGHEAGIDVIGVFGSGLVEQTIGVDSLRASVDKVAAFLKASGTSDAAYVKALGEAHLTLGKEMVKHKDITGMAGRLKGLFEDFPSAAEAAKKTAAIGELAR